MTVGFIIFLVLASIWELIWKGLGMWKAARNKHKAWFVVILIFNTLGLLPIIYYFLIGKKKKKNIVGAY